jgi:hypothetical protein
MLLATSSQTAAKSRSSCDEGIFGLFGKLPIHGLFTNSIPIHEAFSPAALGNTCQKLGTEYRDEQQ